MFLEKAENQNLISYGMIVDGRWRIERILGEGSFGTVYKIADLKDTPHHFAMKIEKNSCSYTDERNKPFDMEVLIMKSLKNKNAKCYPAYKSSGCHKNVYNYIVMDLVGKNLLHLMKKRPNIQFSLPTCMHIGRQSLIAIEELHRSGFLHRDIKPSNFAIGKTDTKKLYILDFGCSRDFLTITGQHKPARTHIYFRGTPRYASSAVLNGHDWGRVDDMWSWFFTLIELTVGKLPWDDDKSRPLDDIHYVTWLANKKRRLFDNSTWFLVGCPVEYFEIYNHLISLKFEDKPKYRLLFKILNDIAEKNGFLNKSNLDWEKS